MINTKIIETYIQNELNTLIRGKHGIGKTAVLRQACENLGLNFLYLPAATLDPYIDLIGVPDIQRDEDGKKSLDFVRRQQLELADVILLDELNRAPDEKTLNACFEMVQFKTINGERLPNLKCVMSSINPTDDEYTTDTLDAALVDRFHIFIDQKPELDRKYLKTVLKEETVDALIKWWKGRGPKADYVSPRRVEYLGRIFEATGDKQILKAAMPPDGTYDVGKLFSMLTDKNYSEDMDQLLNLDDSEKLNEYVRQIGEGRILSAINESTNDNKNEALNRLAGVFNQQFGPVNIAKFLGVIDRMNESHIEKMVSGWPVGKRNRMGMSAEIKEYKSDEGGVNLFRKALDD